MARKRSKAEQTADAHQRRAEAGLRKLTSIQLAQRLKVLRAAKAKAVRRIRAHCKAGRAKYREHARARRAAARAAVNAELAAERQALRSRCEASVGKVRGQSAKEQAKAKAKAKRRKAETRTGAQRAGRVDRILASERRGESDDIVRGNIPPELRKAFERVKHRIHGTKRLSRTEQFLEMAHGEPEEIIAQQHEDAEREVAALLKAHKAALRKTRGKPPELPPETHAPYADADDGPSEALGF